jgi:hypothetical protein
MSIGICEPLPLRLSKQLDHLTRIGQWKVSGVLVCTQARYSPSLNLCTHIIIIIIFRTLLRHILLPSRHKPHHDGMDWNERDVLCYKDKPRTIPV